MERVNHVDIVQVGSGSLVGYVDRMLQWQIPYREGLEFGITGTYAALVFVIQLTEAYSHLTRTRSRSRDDNQLTRRLYIVILAKAIIAGYEFNVVGIAVDEVMHVRLDAHALQAMTELVGSILTIVMRDDYRTHHKVTIHEFLAQAQHLA